MRTGPRRGFTMVELLVVMSIIAILIGMLLPAVNVARESARRSRCSNNIRQVGLALNNYHQTHKIFPPSMFVAPDEEPTNTTKHQMNWVVCLLPLLDQTPIYKQFDLKKPINDQANYQARGATIQVLLCTSDTGSNVKFNRTNDGENWARGNYGANASLVALSKNNLGSGSAYWSKGWLRGVMGANVACSIDEIYDGVTNTILLEELRIGVSDKDRRGTWALGGPGSSSLWAHTGGPNSTGADQILGCDDVRADTTVRNRMSKESMNCAPGKPNVQATARSRHPGGVHVCLADASVRFISDSIEKSTKGLPGSIDRNTNAWAQDFRIWERLNASGDRLPVDMTRF